MIDYVYNTNFIIHCARFATVGPEWTRKTFPYPHHRLYYITAGEAKLNIKDGELILKKDFIYLLPAFSLVEAICEESISQHYIHFQSISNFQDNLFEFHKPKYAISADHKVLDLFHTVEANYYRGTIYNNFLAISALTLLLEPFLKM